VHYSNYKCSENDTSITDCSREASGGFSHEGDVIVECSDIDKKNQDDIKPQDGTVRLVGPSGSPSTSKTGRVEIYKNGRWGGICNQGWTTLAAQIACKTMSYKDGSAIGEPGTFKACEVNGESFCVQSDKDFVVTNVSCKPDEKSLKNCGSSNKISCSAEMTAMAVCEGDGDNSGNSQKEEGAGDPKKTSAGSTAPG